MSYNIVTKLTVPPPPYEYGLVCIPREAIPFVQGAIRIKRAKYWYLTEADWHRAEDLLVRFQEGLMNECSQGIIDAVDRVTVRLDAALFGIGRTVTGTGEPDDPFVYSPAIPQAIEPSDSNLPGLITASDHIRLLVHNLADGSATTLTSETRNIRDLLDRIAVAAEATDADQEDLESLLNLVLLALG